MNQLSTSRSFPFAATLWALTVLLPAQGSYGRTNKLFDGGTNGYHSYRIPCVVRAHGNILLAFCEGRVRDRSDWGNINLVYRRSTDNGRTWSALIELEGVGPGGYKNPTAVYERPWSGRPNGRVHLFYNWHSDQVTSTSGNQHGDVRTFYKYSDDGGLRWSARRDLTAALLPKNFTWDSVGPGAGIQKERSPNIGRLIIPATQRNFYSDDHGATWRYDLVPTSNNKAYTGEATIAECADGSLVRNDRATGTYWPTAKRRWVSRGRIGDFPNPAPQSNLYCPRSHASMLRYNINSPPRLIFLNSASTANRRRMKVRISYDDGLTWPRDNWPYVKTPPDNHRTPDAAMNAGKGGYSAMAKTADFHVAALVEIDEGFTSTGTNMSIDFHRFNLAWILAGAAEPVYPEILSAQSTTLPNVTSKGFDFSGRRLNLVKKVYFGGIPITSQSASSFGSGWFHILSPTRIAIHPPQGLPLGVYPVSVASDQVISSPRYVSLGAPSSPTLLGPGRARSTWPLYCSVGQLSRTSLAFLAVSTRAQRTNYLPVVDLGIGAQGSVLVILYGPQAAARSSGALVWKFPALSTLPPLYFQAAIADGAASNPLPLWTSNVEAVRF